MLNVVGSNVGIGTTSPSTKLQVSGGNVDVSGSGNVYTRVKTSTNSGVAYFVANNDVDTTTELGTWGSTTNSYGVISANNGYIFSGQSLAIGSASDVKFGTGASNAERMRITGAGNVGIGTSSPSAKLDVDSTGYSIFANNSSGNRIVRIGTHSSSGEPAVQATLSNGTSRYLLLNPEGGNVLIGTTADNGYRLRVSGKGYFDNNVVITPTSESWAEGLSFVMPTSATWGGLRWRRERAGADGNWYIGFTALDSTDDLVFGANNGGSQIDNIIRLTKAGNVGIGTSSPTAKLVVNGGGFAVQGDSTPPSSGYGLEIWNSSTTSYIGSYNRTTSAYRDTFLFASNTIFENGGSERMRITAAGNVGIGTTSPSAKLSIIGGTELHSTAQTIGMVGTGGFNSNSYNWAITSQGDTNWGFRVSNKANGQYFTDVLGSFSDGNNRGFRVINKSDATETVLMFINSNGNVGIGTTAPSQKLTIGDGAGTGNQYIRLHSSAADIYIGQTGSNLFGAGNGQVIVTDSTFTSNFAIGTLNSSANFILGTNNTERMRITSAGNVGIGTTAPGAKIHGVNDNFDTAQGFLLEGYKSTYSATSPVVYIKGNWEYNTSRTTDPLLKVAAYNDPNGFYILHSGNVGIGTTSPGQKLHVVGKIYSIDSGTDGGQIIVQNSGGGNAWYWAARTDGLNLGQLTVADGRIFITNAGNVGIGTTAPTYKFNVITDAVAGRQNLAAINRTSGNFVTFTNPQYSVDASMGLMLRVFPQSDSRQGAGIIASGGALNGETDLSLFVSSGIGTSVSYGALNIKGDTGNVGIGTSSPTFSNGSGLVVHSAGASRIKLSNPTSGQGATDGFEFIMAASDAYVWNYEAGPMLFGTSSTERMRITSGGNVGIGTSSPGGKLEVNVTAASAATALILRTNDGSSGNSAIRWQNNSGTNQAAIGSNFNVSDNGALEFINNTTTNMVLRSNGNLGIGVTSAFGNGVKVIGIANATTVPNADPSGGGVLYVEAGALKYRGSSGTITTIAPA